MLCASAYAKGDFALLGLHLGKCLKWGYFPETKTYDDISRVIKNKKPNSILWTARLIDWKHPEIPIEVAKRLKKSGYDFTLNMIGVGPLEEGIKGKIKEYGLEKEVKLLGSMPPERVREEMEKSEIFLFTSDRQEGWGAVLNESMNSACAVLVNNEIGAAPYLVKDGENGLIYHGNNAEIITEKVKRLLDNKSLREKLGLNAYETIKTTWNAEVAAKRLIELINNGMNKKTFKSGPCSKA